MNLLEKMRQQKLLSATLMIFTLSVGILIGTLFDTQVHAARAQNAAPDASPLVLPKAVAIGNDFSRIAKKLEPSVVYIMVEIAPKTETTQNRRRQAPQDNNGDDDGSDLFRRFFGNGVPQLGPQETGPQEASGSGFIVDKNGYIVTNRHVVDGATKIRVRLQDDPEDYHAKVIGEDYETDLAVIKIDARRPLPPVTIGNSDAVEVGDWAVAIGSPFGQVGSVTAGIISATGRSLQGQGGSQLQHFIQTDAAINPGNSGGPLLNIRGEVIGVNTMIATSRGGSEGVGFALPVNLVAKVYNDIIRDGRVTRGSIGATVDGRQEVLKGLGVDHGVIISELAPGGPAEKAGVKVDDIIKAVNGQAVKSSEDLVSRVADIPVGQTADLAIDRDGKQMDVKVTIADRMEVYRDHPEIVGENYTPDEGTSRAESTPAVKFGIQVSASLSDDDRNLTPDKHGVKVTRVEQGSFADDIGMMGGDVIVAINRKPVSSPEDVRRVASSLKPGDAVTFQVVRPNPEAQNVRGRAAASPEVSGSIYLAGTLPE